MRTYDVLEQPDGTYIAIGAGNSYSSAGLCWAWQSKPYFIPAVIVAFAAAAGILWLFTAIEPARPFGFNTNENRAFGIILAATFLAVVFVYFQTTVNRWRKQDLVAHGSVVVATRISANDPAEAIGQVRPKMVYDDPLIHRAVDLRDAGRVDEARSIFQRLIDEGHADKRVIGYAKRQLTLLRRRARA